MKGNRFLLPFINLGHALTTQERRGRVPAGKRYRIFSPAQQIAQKSVDFPAGFVHPTNRAWRLKRPFDSKKRILAQACVTQLFAQTIA